MASLNTKFNSIKQDWETPLELFNPLNAEFNFTLDVCATSANAKVSTFYSEHDNGLTKNWSGTCWMNPPFNQVGRWVQKAYSESLKGATVVCLLPSRTNTNWWHDYCLKGQIRFIRGRPRFNGATHGLPQPLSIVIFNPYFKGAQHD